MGRSRDTAGGSNASEHCWSWKELRALGDSLQHRAVGPHSERERNEGDAVLRCEIAPLRDVDENHLVTLLRQLPLQRGATAAQRMHELDDEIRLRGGPQLAEIDVLRAPR